MLVLVTCKETGGYEQLSEGRFYFAESESLQEKQGVFYVVVYDDIHKGRVTLND